MTWEEALEKNILATGHERYRDLCAEKFPQYLVWREEMVRMATGAPNTPFHASQTSTVAPAKGCGCGADRPKTDSDRPKNH